MGFYRRKLEILLLSFSTILQIPSLILVKFSLTCFLIKKIFNFFELLHSIYIFISTFLISPPGASTILKIWYVSIWVYLKFETIVDSSWLIYYVENCKLVFCQVLVFIQGAYVHKLEISVYQYLWKQPQHQTRLSTL